MVRFPQKINMKNTQSRRGRSSEVMNLLEAKFLVESLTLSRLC